MTETDVCIYLVVCSFTYSICYWLLSVFAHARTSVEKLCKQTLIESPTAMMEGSLLHTRLVGFFLFH